jgi:hypothetical protein
MKALVLAQADAAEGKLSDERQTKIQSTIDEIIDDLSDYSDQEPSDAPAATDAEEVQTTPAVRSPSDGKILCIPSRSALDGAATAMLAQILEKRGLDERFRSSNHIRRPVELVGPGGRRGRHPPR